MADFEGIKLNMENVVSNSTGTVISSLTSKENQIFSGNDKGTLKSSAQDVVQSPVSGLSEELSGAATDASSALSKASLCESASEKLSNFSNEISENLSNNIDSFQTQTDYINKSVQDYIGIGKEADSILAIAAETVNGNANLLGLDFSFGNRQKDFSTIENTFSELPVEDANTLELINQQTMANISQVIGMDEFSYSSNNSDKTTDKSDGEKKVYSCDWGNGAKTSEEIEENNDNIKLFGRGISIGNLLDLSSVISKKDNSSIINELNAIKNKRSKEIKMLRNDKEEDKILSNLRDGVNQDYRGVQNQEAKNATAISQENSYADQLQTNNSNGNSYFVTANGLTEKASAMALSGKEMFGYAAEVNKEAAELFSDSSKEKEAKELADIALGYINEGNASSQNAASIENESRQKQQSAFELTQQSTGDIIPQFEQSTTQRVMEAGQSLDIQKTTAGIIENKIGKRGIDSSVEVENLGSKEQSLIAKYNDNLQNTKDTASRNKFLTNSLSVAKINEGSKKHKTANFIA